MNLRLLATGLACLALLNGCSRPEPADLLFFGGKVLTVDKDFSIHSAVVVKDGRIIAVGDDSLAKRYESANVVDLRGRVLMPGFNDNHFHGGGRSSRAVEATDVPSIAELQERIRAKAGQLGPGEWISGYGWDESVLAEGRKPVKADLDAAAPENPVVISRSGSHSAVGNSLAMKIAGIDRNTKDPPRGVIERDAKGEPNGIIRERTDLYLTHVPKVTDEEIRPSVIANMRRMTSLGLTSVTIAGATTEDEVPQDTVVPGSRRISPSFKTWRGIYEEVGEDLPRATVLINYIGPKAFEALPFKTGDGNDRIKVGAIGEAPQVDGGFTGPTAWTTRDYKGQPGFRGRGFFDEAGLQQVADHVASKGWQLSLHTIGDAAIDMAAKVFAESLRRHPQSDPRWYLAHYTMLPSKETMELMAREGILAAAQPNFLYTLESRYLETLEGEALEHNNPVAVPMKHGVFIGFGSDTLPIDPRVGLYAAVTRKGRSGRVYGPEEAVSIQDAIRMYTWNTAYLNHDEKKKGSIEVGKFADLIIVDRDPLSIPPEELLTMQIDMTFINGKRVFTRDGAAH